MLTPSEESHMGVGHLWRSDARWTGRDGLAPHLMVLCGIGKWVGTEKFTGLTFGSNSFVAVGSKTSTMSHYFDQRAYYSTNGVGPWTIVYLYSAGAGDGPQSVGYDNGLLVAVGTEGKILTATPNSAWTNQLSGTANSLWGIGNGNNVFVTVGNAGEILTSSDGVSWIERPSGITNILRSVAYGNGCFVAIGNMGTILESGNVLIQPPSISIQPSSQFGQVGSNATFNVVADGQQPLSYQWLFNGSLLSTATNASLSLTNVQFANAGSYSVIVSNAYGSVTSASATLNVLTVPPVPPIQIPDPPLPPKPAGKDSLVVITHGWQPFQPNADLSWMTAMSSAIRSSTPNNWVVTNFVWIGDAIYANPELVLAAAEIHGRLYGRQLANQGWNHIHFIGHSAGAGLIENAAAEIPFGTTIHCTFLDPFLGLLHEKQSVYGSSADWSECYFAEDVAGGFTSGGLANAYNVDVSWVDPNRQLVSYGTGQAAFSTHSYPYEFYTATVTGSVTNSCPNAYDYGFTLSREKLGAAWNNNPANYPKNNAPLMLCGQPGFVQNPNAGLVATFAVSSFLENAYSGAVNFLGNAAASLTSALGQPLQLNIFRPLDGNSPTYTNAPAWLAVGLTITNTVNFVQFDAAFTDTNAAEGLLTVYWNTNQIGLVDERVVDPGLQTYHFALPGTVMNGLYVLSFRLDAFNNASSSVTVTNVSAGFVGVTQSINLGMAMGTNGAPILQLTGASNFTYLVQSSTNLIDWMPSALILSTNGTVLFADLGWTNSSVKFYRALMP